MWPEGGTERQTMTACYMCDISPLASEALQQTCPQKHNKSRSNIPTVSQSVWNRPSGFDSTLIYNVREPPRCNLTSPWHQITRSMSWGCTVRCFIHHWSCVYWTQQAEPVCVTGFSVLCSDKILSLNYIHSKSVSGISWQVVNIAKLSFQGANVQQCFSKQRTIKNKKKLCRYICSQKYDTASSRGSWW